MSTLFRTDEKTCGVCGQPGGQIVQGVSLCNTHAPIARRLESLHAAQTDSTVDVVGRRSEAPRDYHSGGYKRPFAVVPPDSVEYVSRHVAVTFHDLPIWSVEALFHRVHSTLSQPDVAGWGATLTIEYDSLDDRQYALLHDFGHTLWTEVTFEEKEAKIYPARSERGDE